MSIVDFSAALVEFYCLPHLAVYLQRLQREPIAFFICAMG